MRTCDALARAPRPYQDLRQLKRQTMEDDKCNNNGATYMIRTAIPER